MLSVPLGAFALLSARQHLALRCWLLTQLWCPLAKPLPSQFSAASCPWGSCTLLCSSSFRTHNLKFGGTVVFAICFPLLASVPGSSAQGSLRGLPIDMCLLVLLHTAYSSRVFAAVNAQLPMPCTLVTPIHCHFGGPFMAALSPVHCWTFSCLLGWPFVSPTPIAAQLLRNLCAALYGISPCSLTVAPSCLVLARAYRILTASAYSSLAPLRPSRRSPALLQGIPVLSFLLPASFPSCGRSQPRPSRSSFFQLANGCPAVLGLVHLLSDPNQLLTLVFLSRAACHVSSIAFH